jgi:type VI protein secretion system component VasF
MHDLHLLTMAVTHQLHRAQLDVIDRLAPGHAHRQRDRGAVTLEQVLWFVAAGVSVVVIAAILWGKIKQEAEADVQVPAAP